MWRVSSISGGVVASLFGQGHTHGAPHPGKNSFWCMMLKCCSNTPFDLFVFIISALYWFWKTREKKPVSYFPNLLTKRHKRKLFSFQGPWSQQKKKKPNIFFFLDEPKVPWFPRMLRQRECWEMRSLIFHVACVWWPAWVVNLMYSGRGNLNWRNSSIQLICKFHKLSILLLDPV